MTNDDFLNEVKRIEKLAAGLVTQAKKDRANQILKDSGIKKGWKIKDKQDAIIIDRFHYGYRLFDKVIALKVTGYLLTKKGEVRKDKAIGVIYIKTNDDFEIINQG